MSNSDKNLAMEFHRRMHQLIQEKNHTESPKIVNSVHIYIPSSTVVNLQIKLKSLELRFLKSENDILALYDKINDERDEIAALEIQINRLRLH